MYSVCSNSMSTLHKYLNYTLDMYLFLLPSFLSLRPASDTVLAPEVIQNECCSSSAQSSALSHQLTTFTLAVSNGPMFQCVHTELAIKWDRVSPNGPLFKCSNSQNIGKTQVTTTGPSEWDIWAGESCAGNTWNVSVYQFYVDNKIRPLNWENSIIHNWYFSSIWYTL